MSQSGLFSPIDIRGLKLKNRIVMPPMASYTGTEEGYITPETSEYYRARAAGGGGAKGECGCWGVRQQNQGPSPSRKAPASWAR